METNSKNSESLLKAMKTIEQSEFAKTLRPSTPKEPNHSLCEFYQWMESYGFTYHPCLFWKTVNKLEVLDNNPCFLKGIGKKYCCIFLIFNDAPKEHLLGDNCTKSMNIDKIKIFDINKGNKLVELYDLVELFQYVYLKKQESNANKDN